MLKSLVGDLCVWKGREVVDQETIPNIRGYMSWRRLEAGEGSQREVRTVHGLEGAESWHRS